MTFDQEIIVEFLDEYGDAQLEIERIVKRLEENLEDEDFKALFRVVHTIKGNFCMMQLDPLSDTIHALEDLLSQVRDKQREFIPGLALLISITVEQCKQLTKKIFNGEDKLAVVEHLTQVYTQLCESPPSDYSPLLLSTLKRIDENGEYGNDYSCQTIIDFLQQAESKPKPMLKSSDTEIEFFYRLITQIESYFPYWKGRSDKIYRLVSQMNEVYGYPVDIKQLQTAVYLHDLGMNFIPPQRIYADKALEADDRKTMQSHCQLGYQWLNLLPEWNEAATMILQHHERYDGTGYPEKIKEKQICAGAKLLAIGDVYASITGQDKKGSQKRPVMFAVAEINQGSGLQFDPEWVQVFNQVIRNFK